MFLSILSSLVLSASPLAPHITIAQPAQAIGCHPQPGKVMGCVTSSHVVAQQRAMGTYQPVVALADPDTAARMACHPDPSRNRGCFRPAPGARVKPAMALKAPVATPVATAQAEPLSASPASSPDASRKSS